LSKNFVFKCPWKEKSEIRAEADSFRRKYGYDTKLPVDIELIIEKYLKICIIPVQDLRAEFDTEAFLKSDLTAIIIDNQYYYENRFQNRTRFTLAHEIGHYVLHKDIYSCLSFSSAKEWIEFKINSPEKEYNNFEWQANEFAGRLLVPYEELINEFKRACASSTNINNNLFGVSTDVVMKRVKSEDLLNRIFYDL
jgi:Zn-dependent peptidase ImmA (M78 family)